MSSAGTDYERLRQLAEAATPGPWELSRSEYVGIVRRWIGEDGYIKYGRDLVEVVGADDDPQAVADATYIAALDPSVVLALLGELVAVRAERDEEHERNRRWLFEDQQLCEVHEGTLSAIETALFGDVLPRTQDALLEKIAALVAVREERDAALEAQLHEATFCIRMEHEKAQAVVRADAAEAERDRLREARDEAEAERDHYRDLVEKVGVVKALERLIAAAEPICGGKPEVRPGRVKLPQEWYPYEAASEPVRVLREALIAARAALSVVDTPQDDA